MRELTERELLDGCRSEDRRSQEILFGRYSRRMYAVCVRYARHRLEAQDLMQEGFIRVFDKLGDFRSEGSLEGWIRRIMVHTCINQYRKKSFQNERFGMENVPDEVVEPLVMESLGQEELMKMISELPDGYRMVFNLYAIEGYDHAEIADLMGCVESTSRSQLAKARRMLQARLKEQERMLHERETSH